MCTELIIRNDAGEVITTDFIDCWKPSCPSSEAPGPHNESDK